MKLKLVDYQSHSDTESDYDTAVDLVHYHSIDTQYIFETENYTTIILSTCETTTTRSYLEPDFDEMEKDFENGNVKDNYPYISHPSEQEPESSKRFRMEIMLPGEITCLTLEEMENYIKYFKEPDGIIDADKLDNTLYNKLSMYHDEGNSVPDYPISLNISESELNQFINGLPEGFKEGDIIDISLPLNIEEQITMYEEDKQKTLLDNEIGRKSNKENFDKAMNIIETKKLATVLENATINTVSNESEQKTSIFSRLRKIFK